MMARKPITFSVGSAKDPDITFNREVALDIMYLNGRPALHIVDMDTHFHAASFLRSVSTDDVWDAIIRNWANTYAGFPESMLTDQGSQLMSARFKEFALHFGIDVRHTPIESHNSNGLVERYHGPLRRTYEKVRLDYGGISDELALSCAVLAANQTLGPEGIVPVTLVLGIIPRISTRLPNQPERVQAMIGAREEMRKLMAKAKVARALKRAVPPGADQFYAVGDRVLVFREEPEGFTGPFRIEHVDHKTIYIRDGNQTKAFSRAQVKPYREITHHREAATEVVAKIGSAVAQDFQTTYVTEVLSPNDQRSNDPKMNQAKKREIKGLLERGTFRIILKSEIPQGANVLGGALCARDQRCRNGTRSMEGTVCDTRSPRSREGNYGSIINKRAATKHQTHICLGEHPRFQNMDSRCDSSIPAICGYVGKRGIHRQTGTRARAESSPGSETSATPIWTRG
jgi:hypothetical protein